jgi:hypothetical protein
MMGTDKRQKSRNGEGLGYLSFASLSSPGKMALKKAFWMSLAITCHVLILGR